MRLMFSVHLMCKVTWMKPQPTCTFALNLSICALSTTLFTILIENIPVYSVTALYVPHHESLLMFIPTKFAEGYSWSTHHTVMPATMLVNWVQLCALTWWCPLTDSPCVQRDWDLVPVPFSGQPIATKPTSVLFTYQLKRYLCVTFYIS